MSQTAPHRGRHPWSVSIRTLMVVVAALAIGLGWYVQQVRVQREAVAAVVAAGGKVWYDWELVEVPTRFDASAFRARSPGKPPNQGWLRRRLGPDVFGHPQAVLLIGKVKAIDAVMPSVGRLRRLKQVTIATPALTDAGMIHLRELSQLSSLSVTGASQLTREGLESLTHHHELRSLNVGGMPLSDTDLSLIGRMTSLRVLTVRSPRVTSAGLKHLRSLSQLRSLTLIGTPIDDLSPLEGLKELRTLVLSGTSVNGRGVAPLASFPALSELILMNNIGVTDEALTSLGRMPALTTLSVVGSPITDNSLLALAEIRTLRTLRLNRTRVTGSGLSPLSTLPNLLEIDPSLSPVDDVGVSALAAFTRLNSISLNRTKVGDSGTAHLAGLATLGSLQLGGTRVTDACLSQLGGLVNLETLTLSGTSITDAGLTRISGLRRLELLVLRGTKPTPAGIAAIQAAIPGIRVVP